MCWMCEAGLSLRCRIVMVMCSSNRWESRIDRRVTVSLLYMERSKGKLSCSLIFNFQFYLAYLSSPSVSYYFFMASKTSKKSKRMYQ